MPDSLQIILLFLAFALVHSVTVSGWFKRLCRSLCGETFLRVWYRFLYTCLSAVTVAVAFAFMHRIPDHIVWQGPPWFRWSLHAVRFGALLFGIRAFDHLDSGEFLGLRQVWRRLAGEEVSGNAEGLREQGLVTTGVYGIVRHPLYLAGICIFTFEPTITRNGLLIAVLADLYFVFGAFIEERRFLILFGDMYREYRRRVPMLVPRIRMKDRL